MEATSKQVRTCCRMQTGLGLWGDVWGFCPSRALCCCVRCSVDKTSAAGLLSCTVSSVAPRSDAVCPSLIKYLTPHRWSGLLLLQTWGAKEELSQKSKGCFFYKSNVREKTYKDVCGGGAQEEHRGTENGDWCTGEKLELLLVLNVGGHCQYLKRGTAVLWLLKGNQILLMLPCTAKHMRDQALLPN